MSSNPPAPSADVPYEDLEALAAGELDPADAEALRLRIQRDPDVAAAYERVLAVEQALRAETLLPAPLGLTERVMDAAIPGRTSRPWQTLARVAAAVLVFFGSWFAFSGSGPAIAEVREPPPLLARAKELVPIDTLGQKITATTAPAVAAATDHAPAMLALILGVLFFAGGIALLLHWHRSANVGSAS